MRGLKKTAPNGADRQTHIQRDMATPRPTRPRGAELVKIALLIGLIASKLVYKAPKWSNLFQKGLNGSKWDN